MPFSIKKKIDISKIELERKLKIERERLRNNKRKQIKNVIEKQDYFINNFCKSYYNQKYRNIYNKLKSISDIFSFTLTYIFIKLKLDLDNIYKRELVYMFFDKIYGTMINKKRRDLYQEEIITYSEQLDKDGKLYTIKEIISNDKIINDKVNKTLSKSKDRIEIENKLVHFMTNICTDKKSIDNFVKKSKFYKEII